MMDAETSNWIGKIIDSGLTIGILIYFVRYFMAELARREAAYSTELAKRDAVIKDLTKSIDLLTGSIETKVLTLPPPPNRTLLPGS